MYRLKRQNWCTGAFVSVLGFGATMLLREEESTKARMSDASQSYLSDRVVTPPLSQGPTQTAGYATPPEKNTRTVIELVTVRHLQQQCLGKCCFCHLFIIYFWGKAYKKTPHPLHACLLTV